MNCMVLGFQGKCVIVVKSDRVKSVPRRLYRREQHRFEQEILPCLFARRHCYGVDCTVSNHSKFSPNKKKKFGVMWAGRQVLRQ